MGMASGRNAQLGIYISVPFCASKCTYCNFASGVFARDRMSSYVERVEQEIRGAAARADSLDAELPRTVDSIYFGGGTPSLLPPELFKRINDAVRAEFQLAGDCEWTVECAPGQLAPETLDAMVQCGVNRISFGAQSFNDRETAAVGRLHTADQTRSAVQDVRRAGIANISVDLIAGLPHQTDSSFVHSVESLIALDVPHASVYMLEVDTDSRLGRELLQGGVRYRAAEVPGDDAIAAMYEDACASLAAAGLARYEISNFARSGAESRHNLRYWERRPYLGFGMDAHSSLAGLDGATVRFANADTLEAYADGAWGERPRRLSAREQMEEAWFLGLRRACGVNMYELSDEYGADDVAAYREAAAALVREGLLACDGESFMLTPRGILLSNNVFSAFLLEDALACD